MKEPSASLTYEFFPFRERTPTRRSPALLQTQRPVLILPTPTKDYGEVGGEYLRKQASTSRVTM